MTSSERDFEQPCASYGVIGQQGVVVFKSLCQERGIQVFDALTRADIDHDYRRIAPFLGRASGSAAPALAVIFAAPGMEHRLQQEIQACARDWRVPIAVVTDSNDLEFYDFCYDCGAKGVLPTSLPLSNITAILQMLAAGGIFLSKEILLARHRC